METCKRLLHYAGLPLLAAALLCLRLGRMDAFTLLRDQLLLVFGYHIALRDLRTKRIENGVIVAMLVAWAILMIPQLILHTSQALKLMLDAAVGLVLGGGLFLLVYLISRKGLGGGDVKFMGAAGLYLGFGRVLPAMLLGTLLLALCGGALLLFKRLGRKDTLPLAPFLYVGILAVLFMS